ncbi:primosomal protein N' [Planococcus shenhongbingii]|uniref:Replication restart protein PriA n=1 Tax=Planococcus shenhongbingii TaxID=3058398 RepID=A0ABT8N9K7_9BACL|nr:MULTISPECIES: primosomal protein N' [unclassified Planococcus (in: firmicutes)]MDN7244235.1 primosomal protein N' [Planococcus sp. N017]WKA57407.1 primosomal protein N' [Planococcus sp. N016]
MIAEVIVDVAAHPIDRPFDYAIPAHLQVLIEPGMRVKVPFGNRKVLGFITAIKETTEFDPARLKPIHELMDVVPVLNKELLEMARWMKEKTVCFEIDALQVMIPSALRAKYEKRFVLNAPLEEIAEPLRIYFEKRPFVRSQDAVEVYGLLKKELNRGTIVADTDISQQTAVKKVRMIHIADSLEKLDSIEIRANAKQQVKLMEYMKNRVGQAIESSHMQKEAGVSLPTIYGLVEKGAAFIKNEESYRDPQLLTEIEKTHSLLLTEAQQVAFDAVERSLNTPKTFLLHGITGSGKTEIYLQTIDQVLKEGKEAIMLVPEISLTPQMTIRFKERFGDLVAVLHSGLSAGEKYDEWRKIQRAEVKVVVGARSAIFAPFENLGLIILDEEHESSYKQDDSPRYHARDVAIWRSEQHNCPVILGSATPSLESYARAQKGVYELLVLEKRAKNQPLPDVQIVDMREELRNGNRSMFSVPLAEAIRDRLEKKEQVVLFLNKRGYSSFVLCRDCGTVMQCPNCDISLTYHRSSELMKCHYCGYDEPVPHICPECESEHIRFFGTGTQKVEEELAKLVPEARVLRMDVDSTRNKGAHEKILSAFGQGKADILLGTQMIAKGLDFPNITLVGVLSADTTLHLPDFRAAEKTYQLLTQVSGRAGRDILPGEVYVQSYTPEHYAITLAKDQLYEPFYEQEMAMRRASGYPPYYYVVNIQFTHEDLMTASGYADQTVRYLQSQLSQSTIIIGPSASLIARVNNRYRYQCLIKYKKEPKLSDVLQQLIKIYRSEWLKKGATLSIDMNPTSVM